MANFHFNRNLCEGEFHGSVKDFAMGSNWSCDFTVLTNKVVAIKIVVSVRIQAKRNFMRG